jgi:thiopeptide-type bacteriocin biosynthesis protein
LEQVSVEFADWDRAEQAAAEHLAPVLDQASSAGLVSGWWFIRKYPCWRVRMLPGHDSTTMRAAVEAMFGSLAVPGGPLRQWRPGRYEAEEAAFGGPEAMAVAHSLFTADSAAVMRLAAGDKVGLGRRALSVLLCTALLRAAKLEWYEQGDAWHHVPRERTLPADAPAAQITGLADTITTLLTADITSASGLFDAGGPLAGTEQWMAAFRDAGKSTGGICQVHARHAKGRRQVQAARLSPVSARTMSSRARRPAHSPTGWRACPRAASPGCPPRRRRWQRRAAGPGDRCRCGRSLDPDASPADGHSHGHEPARDRRAAVPHAVGHQLAGQRHHLESPWAGPAQRTHYERAGQPHLLRHRRDRHAPRNSCLGHQATSLPGPPRPGRAPGIATGTRRMHARLGPGRQVTRATARSPRPRGRERSHRPPTAGPAARRMYPKPPTPRPPGATHLVTHGRPRPSL